MKMKTRKCRKCGKMKNLATGYYKQGKGGYEAICRICRCAKVRNTYWLNSRGIMTPRQINIAIKKIHPSIREEIVRRELMGLDLFEIAS